MLQLQKIIYTEGKLPKLSPLFFTLSKMFLETVSSTFKWLY